MKLFDCENRQEMAQIVSDYYDGCRLFSGLSDYLGISVDKVSVVLREFVDIYCTLICHRECDR